ncbi:MULTISPECIES: type II secretion system F family protein [Sphingobium]|uniref:Secretion system protein n=1 Tax=Sphingobium chungbukense TaxID=56193 RepID=A0A0M3AVH8_9SPHN|nr:MULTISPECIES: type II secretion system F family protein [Sphingobium]KKW92911.1 secretion system protein [Sphingobium chungbukense]PJG46966.1 secretion system protein [Sphingobium sp. LB126]
MNPLYIRVFILILLFAAVILLIEGISSWLRARASTERVVNRRLKMIAAGYERSTVLSKLRRNSEEMNFNHATLWGRAGLGVLRTLHGAGLTIPARTVLMLMGIAAGLLFLLVIVGGVASGYGLTAGMIVMAVAFAVALGIFLPMMVLTRLSQRRRKKMEEQFPVALDTFVRGLRAGHPIAAALELLTKEMRDPIGSEFGIVVDEVTYGADLRDALQRMAERWDMNEMHMFVISLSVQSETGGNLAEILENLSLVIRERASLFMKVRALSSEGRMTAIMLTALPILAFVGLFMVNPAFYMDVAQDRMFIFGFSGLIILYMIGFITIRRMVDLKV